MILEKRTLQRSGADRSFMKGAMVMSMSMVIVKLIGMVYKVLLGSVVTGVGYGIFTLAYSLYDPLFMLATGGFPIAISRLVSKSVAENRYRDVKKLHKITIPLFIITGTICFTAMVLLSGWYSGMVRNENVRFAVCALAPTILFGCLMSIYRGYFEGMRNMVPTAISEVIEAGGKLLVGLTAAVIVSNIATNEYRSSGTVFGVYYGDNYTQATSAIDTWTICAALLGIVAGAALGFIFLVMRYKFKGCDVTRRQLYYSEPARTGKEITWDLVKTAIPIGLNSLVLSISSTIDSTLIQMRITDLSQNSAERLISSFQQVSGATMDYSAMAQQYVDNGSFATFLTGSYGYAQTLMMLVTALTQAFGSSALPSLTAAWTRGDKDEIRGNMNMILKLTLCVALPAGLALAVFAQPLIFMLYGRRDVFAADVAAQILQILGISVIFIATSTPICSMLQAVGRVDLPLKLMSIAMVIKIALNYTLVGIPEINIQGAAVGSLVAYLFVVVVGLYFLCKETKIVPDFLNAFIKPLIAAAVCVVLGKLAFNLLEEYIMPYYAAMIIVVVLVVIMYILALTLLRAVTKNEISAMPKGEKIAKLLEKIHVLR